MMSRMLLRSFSSALSRRTLSTTAARSTHYLSATPETFDKVAVKGGKVALVDFYADWCGPCKMLTPILKKVVPEESDVDQEYKISALPTVIAIKDGKVLGQFKGAQPEGAVRQWLQGLSQ
ncbi:thioredoxin [Pseudohyphozyma bogoriensis]|nr:thioredoxin [Pseudohyphozyma bogoriensis]